MPERIHRHFDEAAHTEPVSNNKKRKRQDPNGAKHGPRSAPSQPTQEARIHGSLQNGLESSPSPKQERSFVAQTGPKSPSSANGRTQKPGPSPMKERAKALWPVRKTLPVWAHAADIRQGLREKDVMLLVGETGSGKSTQVPQILANEKWCQPQDMTIPAPLTASKKGSNSANVTVGGCIAVTEPRRVAAITLARRVAEEMGTPLGSSSPLSKVGYSVRFDNSTSPSTRIKFLTEGMLLQEMLRDPWLKAYSAVVVDEVHERGVNVDLVMGFMRQMVAGRNEGRGGIPLKVVVMSATAETERLTSFFEYGFSTPSPKSEERQTLDGQKHDRMDEGSDEGSDESEWSGISSSSDNEDEGGKTTRANGTHFRDGGKSEDAIMTNGHKEPEPNAGQQKKQNLPLRHVSTCYIEGRQYPVTIKYTPEPVQDIVDAALRTIFQIHHKEPMPGDILVFLTGQETVESLESLVKEYAQGLGPDLPKLLVLPLFAALPQAAQQRVFQPPPSKTRKVIIATNIAETSVTVSGVRFVIDCGKAKIKHFRTSIGLDSLLVKPISKSAAIQRKGRAGREAPGQCYRLYTEPDYLTLQQSNTPEILRCDLSHAILTMKARGVEDVINFPFLDHPPREALEKALLQLYQLGALIDTGIVSEIGHRMAKLPLTVSLGRVLIAAAKPEFDCVSEVIDIISCLSVENIFLNLTSEEKKEQAETARRELYRREGDHLTLLTTVQAYAAEHSDRKAWAERHFVSHRAMQAVMDVRKQLRQQSKDLLKEEGQRPNTLTAELSIAVLKCFLRGFATSTARLFPDGSYKTIVGNQAVAIHPSSGLFGRKIEAIMYNEFVFTNKSYARGVSAVQMDWIGEALGV